MSSSKSDAVSTAGVVTFTVFLGSLPSDFFYVFLFNGKGFKK
jgi:hypothetical protein